MSYVAIACLAMLIVFIVVQAYTGRLSVMSLPFIVGCMFAYLYVISPLVALHDGRILDYVSARQVAWAVWVPLIMLAALLVGWKWTVARLKERSPAPPRPLPDPRRVYLAGLVLAGLGLGLWVIFLSFSGGMAQFYEAVHGSTGRWMETTAYLYGGLLYIYPGLVLMIIANRAMGRVPPWRRALPMALFALLLAHALLSGSRGHLFRLFGAFFVAAYFLRRSRPSVTTVLAGGAVVGIFLISLAVYRDYTAMGRWTELRRVGLGQSLEYVVTPGPGNEFTLHAGTLATVDKTGRLGFGERYLWYQFVQPIPRLLWPSKPHSLPSGTITSADMARAIGWVPSVGSASGLVADWYREWGVFSFLAWLLVGVVAARIYVAALRRRGDPWWLLIYALAVSGSLNLVAQGFLAFWSDFLLQVGLSAFLWFVVVRGPLWAHRAPSAERRATWQSA